MLKNKKIATGLIFAAAALIIMMFSSIPSASSKEMPISDLVGNPEKYEGDYLMTQGLLDEESIEWDSDKIQLRFSLRDENEENISLPIFHEGIKPDNFSEGIIVIVEGFLNDDGVFEAEKVQTKCPSKYEGEEYDPEMHNEMFGK